jgi:hypothetical protein
MSRLVFLDKQYRYERNDTKKKKIKFAQADKLKLVITDKKKLLTVQKDIREKSQAVEDLFSANVQGMIDSMTQDKAALTKFETIVEILNMPKLP